MVRLTLDKAYTVHARSTDRVGDNDTPSDYRLAITDPISCPNDAYMKCTLINAKIPSTFYQIDSRNRTFKVVFNDFTAITPFQSTMLPFAFPDTDVDSPDSIAGVQQDKRVDYKREITVNLDQGNYTIEQLLTSIKTLLNDACTASHEGQDFRTFLRDPDHTAQASVDDITDSGTTATITEGHIVSRPVFETEYNEKLNKVKIFRTDEGGRMVLGAFWIQCSGTKLNKALGFDAITAQMERRLNIIGQATPIVTSLHYRQLEIAPSTTEMSTVAKHGSKFHSRTQLEHHGYPVPNEEEGAENIIGNGVYSSSTINMFANDTVYVRIRNLPSNSYETLSGGTTCVMAVIPMYVGSASENFFSPNNVTSTVIGQATVSQLDIQLTGADGIPLEFNNADNEFSLLFECYQLNTYENKPPDENYGSMSTMSKFTNKLAGHHARLAAPLPTGGLSFNRGSVQ